MVLAALDIGTHKIAALVVAIKEDGSYHIRGIGSSPSRGMARGVVVNIEEMTASIKQAIEEAELMMGTNMPPVYVGISGEHIRGVMSRGASHIRANEVAELDMKNVIATARTSTKESEDGEILHFFPREFIVDKEPNIKDPRGMSGRHLEAKVYIIIGGKHQIQNILKCLQESGLIVAGIVHEPVASGMAVLTDDERELGVCMIDIGGGTTDIAVYTKGEIIKSAVIPIAGDHVSSDIAKILRTPLRYAEELKEKYGCTQACIKNSEETIEVQALSDDCPSTSAKRQILAEIIEARYDEIFRLVLEFLANNFAQGAVSCVVLSGGAAKLEGLADLATATFDMPVRVGKPRSLSDTNGSLKDPIYATSIGLLLYAATQSQDAERDRSLLENLKLLWSKARSQWRVISNR